MIISSNVGAGAALRSLISKSRISCSETPPLDSAILMNILLPSAYRLDRVCCNAIRLIWVVFPVFRGLPITCAEKSNLTLGPVRLLVRYMDSENAGSPGQRSVSVLNLLRVIIRVLKGRIKIIGEVRGGPKHDTSLAILRLRGPFSYRPASACKIDP